MKKKTKFIIFFTVWFLLLFLAIFFEASQNLPADIVNNYQVAPVENRSFFLHSRYICDCKKTCQNIFSCKEAFFQLYSCGCDDRDVDGDGMPCPNLCD